MSSQLPLWAETGLNDDNNAHQTSALAPSTRNFFTLSISV
jgi:hypothetical protein